MASCAALATLPVPSVPVVPPVPICRTPALTVVTPVYVLAEVSASVPAPVVVNPPPTPDKTPLRNASTTALPSLVRTVRAALPRLMALRKSIAASAVAEPKCRLWPVGTKPPAPHVSGAPAPPRFTIRSAPKAAKPPLPCQRTPFTNCVALDRTTEIAARRRQAKHAAIEVEQAARGCSVPAESSGKRSCTIQPQQTEIEPRVAGVDIQSRQRPCARHRP